MQEPASEQAERRPGPFWRALAGAFHVPAGIVFLLRTPQLWPLAALPTALTALLLIGGVLGGVFAVPFVDDLLSPRREETGALSLLIAAVLWAALPVTGLLIGLALALLLASPILERLSRAVERLMRGETSLAPERGLRWEVAQSLRAALYFAVRTPGMLLLGLVPLVGPFLGALWGAHALAFQMTESPLQRQGLDFWERRAWHRRNRAESLGFGLAGVVTLFVPFANLLLAPALTVGATRLVLELQQRPASESGVEASAS